MLRIVERLPERVVQVLRDLRVQPLGGDDAVGRVGNDVDAQLLRGEAQVAPVGRQPLELATLANGPTMPFGLGLDADEALYVTDQAGRSVVVVSGTVGAPASKP